MPSARAGSSPRWASEPLPSAWAHGPAAGGTAIDTSSPIERLFRDAHAAAAHATASIPTYEQWGRVLIHPDPESLPRQPGPPLL